MVERHLFTSESISEGHPDKIADQIDDAILGAILKQGPTAQVAHETFVTTGLVLIFGKISTTAYVDIQRVVWETVKEIDYTRAKLGFSGDTAAVLVAIDGQSLDIAQGVDEALEIRDEDKKDVLDETGAGDQGLMFGFAVDETPELMPLPIALSHRLVRRLADLCKPNELTYLHPDAESRVTIEYDDQRQPERVDAIVTSTRHDDTVDNETIRHDTIEKVVKEVIPAELLDDRTRYYIDPTGQFAIGGPQGDVGLTRRKTIVGTYGNYTRHGGGAFSGKSATKVDHSASYAARYIAKNIAAAGLTREAEVQPAYAIGITQLVSISVNTFSTGMVPEEELIAAMRENFDLRPAGIIEMLGLRRPIYKQTATYGHLGCTDVDLSWEYADEVDTLRASSVK